MGQDYKSIIKRICVFGRKSIETNLQLIQSKNKEKFSFMNVNATTKISMNICIGCQCVRQLKQKAMNSGWGSKNFTFIFPLNCDSSTNVCLFFLNIFLICESQISKSEFKHIPPGRQVVLVQIFTTRGKKQWHFSSRIPTRTRWHLAPLKFQLKINSIVIIRIAIVVKLTQGSISQIGSDTSHTDSGIVNNVTDEPDLY